MTSSPTRTIFAIALGLVLLGGACSSSKSSGPPTTSLPFWKTVPTVDMRGKATGSPLQVHVQVGDDTFTPEVLRVDPGVTVVWADNGANVHNIVKNDFKQDFGGQFGIDKIVAGGTYQFTFAKAGVYQYNCTLHTGMVGLVAVGNVTL